MMPPETDLSSEVTSLSSNRGSPHRAGSDIHYMESPQSSHCIRVSSVDQPHSSLIFGNIKYSYVSDNLEPDGSILSFKLNFSE